MFRVRRLSRPGSNKLLRVWQVDKTGVVYLSKVPPYMKPDKIRTLLRKFGEVPRPSEVGSNGFATVKARLCNTIKAIFWLWL